MEMGGGGGHTHKSWHHANTKWGFHQISNRRIFLKMHKHKEKFKQLRWKGWSISINEKWEDGMRFFNYTTSVIITTVSEKKVPSVAGVVPSSFHLLYL